MVIGIWEGASLEFEWLNILSSYPHVFSVLLCYQWSILEKLMQWKLVKNYNARP